MKLTLGGYGGKVIPRVFNPIVFAFTALALTIGAGLMLLVAALCLAYTPFSFFSKVRMKD